MRPTHLLLVATLALLLVPATQAADCYHADAPRDLPRDLVVDGAGIQCDGEYCDVYVDSNAGPLYVGVADYRRNCSL